MEFYVLLFFFVEVSILKNIFFLKIVFLKKVYIMLLVLEEFLIVR